MDMQELGDRLEIRELIERCSLNVTTRDYDAVGACFHPDARWRLTAPKLEYEGRAAIQKGIIKLTGRGEFLVQMAHSIVIDDLTAERATARVVLNEVGRNSADQKGFLLLGVYSDVITKVGGRWLFELRTFEPYYLDWSWISGDVVVDYAKLAKVSA